MSEIENYQAHVIANRYVTFTVIIVKKDQSFMYDWNSDQLFSFDDRLNDWVLCCKQYRDSILYVLAVINDKLFRLIDQN